MPQIELEHLGRSYAGADGLPLDAVKDITLTVQRGEFLVLTGPSGSGKTTLLRLVAGLERPTTGTVSIGGRPVHSIPARERPIAMVFQTPALFPEMSVRENLAFGLVVRGFPREEIARRVTEAIEVLGLGPCLNRKPGVLSGGERQRVALGRALVRRPEVLLLDEPLSSLDSQLRGQLRAAIRDLHARIGGAAIYVTHDQSEALLLGDSLAVLHGGRLEQIGPPEKLYECPATSFVAQFLGPRPMNLFPGQLRFSDNQLRFQEGSGAFELLLPPTLPVSPGGAGPLPVHLGIRPEHLLVDNPAAPDHQVWPAIDARVERVESIGPETFLAVRCGQIPCLARFIAGERVAPGTLVRLRLNPARIRFFHAETGCSLDRET